LSKENFDYLKGFKLSVEKIHIRFEDDYFAETDKAYSFGIVIDVSTPHC